MKGKEFPTKNRKRGEEEKENLPKTTLNLFEINN